MLTKKTAVSCGFLKKEVTIMENLGINSDLLLLPGKNIPPGSMGEGSDETKKFGGLLR